MGAERIGRSGEYRTGIQRQVTGHGKAVSARKGKSRKGPYRHGEAETERNFMTELHFRIFTAIWIVSMTGVNLFIILKTLLTIKKVLVDLNVLNAATKRLLGRE